MTGVAVPSGWEKRDESDDEMMRYNPQPVTQYEHAATGVGVQLLSINPKTERAMRATASACSPLTRTIWIRYESA